MCVCVGCGVLQERYLQENTGLIDRLTYSMCVCTLARRWSGQKHHLFTEGETSVRVCMHVRVCVCVFRGSDRRPSVRVRQCPV